MRTFTIVLCLGGACALGLGVFSTLSAPDSQAEPSVRSVAEPAPISEAQGVNYDTSPDRAVEALSERVPVPAQVQNDGDNLLVQPLSMTVWTQPLDPNVAQLLGDQHSRIGVLEVEIARLSAELDECRNGPYSALGTLHALPEWAGMDKSKQAVVLDFLRRFPVRLCVGEATLIADYAPPNGGWTRGIIAMLGRGRVLQSLSPEAQEKYRSEDPEEFLEYFGVR